MSKEEPKHNSDFWHMIYMIQTNRIILDPDGWDRKNYERSWGEETTWDEFNKRAMMSTQYPVDFNHIVKTLTVYGALIEAETRKQTVESCKEILRAKLGVITYQEIEMYIDEAKYGIQETEK